MGPRAWLAALCVLGSVLAPVRGQTRLEWKWKEGDRFYVETVNTLKDSTRRDEQDFKTEMQITTVDLYKVLRNDAAGVVLEKTTTAQRFKGSSSGGADLDAQRQKSADALADRLKGLVLTITLAPDLQKVSKIDGVREFMKRVRGDENADPTRFGEIIREEQENIFAGYLPDKPVQPGQNWQRSIAHVAPDPIGNYKAEVDYSFKGKEMADGKALEHISAVWTVTFVPPKQSGGYQTSADLKAEPAKADYFFDAAAGRLARSDRTFHVKGKVTVTGQGKTTVYDVDQTQEWRVRLSDENPAAK
jgi:hypothetical protein